MKKYRVKLAGRDDWQEWTLPDHAGYSSSHGWDYLLWGDGSKLHKVWIRRDQAEVIQFTEDLKEVTS